MTQAQKFKKFASKKREKSELKENVLIEKLCKQVEEFDLSKDIKCFNDLPISPKTREGLKKHGFTVPTEIQASSIGLALKGHDILGAAKTGSGKTLAFIIPLLEKLYREKWIHLLGPGVLIITPTRELAYQIFDVINKVGSQHNFSVGLVIGGKDLDFEWNRVDRCNIMICTPGRLLHHLNKNPCFNCDYIQMLILDEADKILDMGFAKELNAIMENLPKERQTLLFSATQTKSVRSLSRLSLNNPKYVFVHENANTVTPDSLDQSVVVCELHQKLDVLWSFLKVNNEQKILVFVSTRKQAKFIYELFCRMRPGIPLLALHADMSQPRRMAIYDEFRNKKKVALITTDISSRGLDFPAVNWVLQLDCPKDIETYIHRSGRTARYEKDGKSRLVLLPSEEAMVEQLKQKKVPIRKINLDAKQFKLIQRKAASYLASDPKLKESAQRAFKAYIKSVFYMEDKSIFNVQKIDKNAYAQSLGLAIPPRVRFLENKFKSDQNTKNECKQTKSTKVQLVPQSKESDEESDDDLLMVKKASVLPDIEIPQTSTVKKSVKKPTTTTAQAKKLLKKRMKVNNKVLFDENGNPIEEVPKSQKSEKAKLLQSKNLPGIDLELIKEVMKDEDQIDKQIQRKIVKEKHKKERIKAKERERLKRGQKVEKSQPKKADKDEDDKSKHSDENDSDDAFDELIDSLPDPDRIYNKITSNSSSKRKRTSSSSDSEDEAPIEELALQFLQH